MTTLEKRIARLGQVYGTEPRCVTSWDREFLEYFFVPRWPNPKKAPRFLRNEYDRIARVVYADWPIDLQRAIEQIQWEWEQDQRPKKRQPPQSPETVEAVNLVLESSRRLEEIVYDRLRKKGYSFPSLFGKKRAPTLPLGITNTDKAAQQNPPPSNGIEKPASGVASASPPLHSAKVSTGGVPPASPQTSPPPLNSAKDAEARMSSAERPTPPSPHDAEKPADGGPPALKPTRRPDPYADRPFPPGPGRSVKPCQYFSEGADIAAVGSRLPTRDAPTKENP